MADPRALDYSENTSVEKDALLDAYIFTFHQGVLSSSSEFFKAALKPEWVERRSEPENIELEHANLGAFKLYVHWLYGGVIPMPTESNSEDTYRRLAYAYVLGEEIMDIKFKNTVLDAFRAASIKFGCFPIGEPVAILTCNQIMHDGTPANSPDRHLFVDFAAHVAWDETGGRNDDFDMYPKEFLVDVIKAMVKVRPSAEKTTWWWLKTKEFYLEKMGDEDSSMTVQSEES
ncbi:hypothetical protein BCR34DRAFT_600443 [Clohesyomyces aquaticus]|uniref:BTB domain-containing protein n=1 Tax=Clohesyomyces aquaticus TaxID=1231657 RepID=A0A1Y1ZRB2_9PLEO|nr:hypothetical protein BCR34DRAFT_600443 [Clohesyomyces aquaticus]